MEPLPETTGHCYDPLAQVYAKMNEEKPWYTCYERPAMTSMFPSLQGIDALDAACGPGWYAEYLHRNGARVTACDMNPEFVEMTRARAGPGAVVVQQDLSKPLAFAKDASFDLITCGLAMHYLRDWVPTLREFNRVLKPGGRLVFSTHHPFDDWQTFKMPDYFGMQIIHDNFPGIGPVQYFRRPMTAIFNALAEAGFVIERLLEPQPTEGFRDQDPKTYEKLRYNPCFLVIRARK
jgi:SAM-dependent methyltransferase